jgi:hypothetical protein
VDEEGLREVLAVEAAGGEKGEAYASLLRALIDRRPPLGRDAERMNVSSKAVIMGAVAQRA